MIRYTSGNPIDADAEALVIAVNCMGVIEPGSAHAFKTAYPKNFKAYVQACGRGIVRPGRVFVFDTGELTLPRYILNFPTKRHPRARCRMEDIESGLESLVQELARRSIRSVAIPALGCGAGGLNWSSVRPRIERALAELGDIDVLLFEPADAPAIAPPIRPVPVARLSPGRAAMVSLMNTYLDSLLDTSISLLDVHKLVYFLQEAGEPLKLRYVNATYGPYAENLRHVLLDMEGKLVAGYADGGSNTEKPLTILPGVVSQAEAYLAGHQDTQQRLDRVKRLIEGFETSFGLELLATVHWVMTRQAAVEADAIERVTYAWGLRKRQFSPAQLGLAAERFREQGWVPALPARA